MKFNPLTIKIKKEKLFQYFVKYKIFQNIKNLKINDKKNNPFIVSRPYGLELHDLYRLHQIILKYKRTTILEFGVGWSTKIMANALLINKKKYSDKVKQLRFNNPFQIHAVDNFKKYINQTKKELNPNEKKKYFSKIFRS